MPRKLQVAAGPSEVAADQKECGLCGQDIERNEEEYIVGTCQKCGARIYHQECVSEYLISKWQGFGAASKRHAEWYRKSPHLDFAKRGGKCPAGSYKKEGSSCNGILVASELVKPQKAMPAPAPVLQPAPAPRAAKKGPTQQQAQQQQQSARAPKPPRVVAQPQPAATLVGGVLRDRLGRKVLVAEGGSGRRRLTVEDFPGGVRPEELTLCRIWEAQGECSVPSCVFAHGEEELEKREREWRAEQARLKKERKRREQEERRGPQESCGSEPAGSGMRPSAASGSAGVEWAAEPAGWALESSGRTPGGAAMGGVLSSTSTLTSATSWEPQNTVAAAAAAGVEPPTAAAASSAVSSCGDVWAELVARARAGMAGLRPSASVASDAPSSTSSAAAAGYEGSGTCRVSSCSSPEPICSPLPAACVPPATDEWHGHQPWQPPCSLAPAEAPRGGDLAPEELYVLHPVSSSSSPWDPLPSPLPTPSAAPAATLPLMGATSHPAWDKLHHGEDSAAMLHLGSDSAAQHLAAGTADAAFASGWQPPAPAAAAAPDPGAVDWGAVLGVQSRATVASGWDHQQQQQQRSCMLAAGHCAYTQPGFQPAAGGEQGEEEFQDLLALLCSS